MMSLFNVQQISFDPVGGWALFVLFLLAAGALATWAYLTSPAPLSRGQRTLLWICRAGALVIVLLVLSRPVVVLDRPVRGKPLVTVLVDRSASMGVRDAGGGQTRLARATEIARDLDERLDTAGDRYDVRVRSFSGGLESETDLVGPLEIDSLGASSAGDAMATLLREPDVARLAGVVLLSDGATTRGRDVVSMAEEMPVPVFAVALGDSVSPPDLQLLGVDVPPAAFVGEPVVANVRLRWTGDVTQPVTLTVSDDQGTVATHDVRIPAAGALMEVPFRITPSRPGQMFYRVEALRPGDAGARVDSVSVNDAARFALDVRKDRLQILVVEEHLSWDYTFLTRTLERDSTLAYSFLVSTATGKSLALGEKRVDAFPDDLASLNAFRAVVIGDVSRAILDDAHCELLARYVEGGGGLLLLGGNGIDGLGRLSDTVLERVSPVELRAPSSAGRHQMSGPLTPRVTMLGDAHPLVALHGDALQNRALWADLPPLRPAAAQYSARPGAQVLVEHGSGALVHPLITIGRSGAGRVLVFSGQSLWKWHFLREGLGGDDDFFNRFWVGAIRWLADPEPLERIRVAPERLVFPLGREVVLAGRVLGADLAPLADASLSATLFGARDSLRLDAEWDEGGGVAFRAGALAPGHYSYRVGVESPGGPPAIREGEFVVDSSGPEYWDLTAKPDELRRASHVSGGLFLRDDGLDPRLESLAVSPVAASVTTEHLLWNHPLPLLVFLVLLGVEWWIRRRSGLA